MQVVQPIQNLKEMIEVLVAVEVVEALMVELEPKDLTLLTKLD